MSAVRQRKTVASLRSPISAIEDVLSGESRWAVALADALDLLPQMPEDSVDAVVVDPPYELAFMGKSWDSLGLSFRPATWEAVLRVLKPGGHLLSFGGTRTWHRIACAIEDAGFEIRDEIMWLYGSGFPKSLDVSKAIDKAARGVPQGGSDPTSANHGKFKTQKTEGKRHVGDKGQSFGAGPGQFMSDVEHDIALREMLDGNIGDLVADAQRWAGWGTALKPAHEPIIVARKPFKGTVANNVLEHGTGALNIDATRISTSENLNGGAYAQDGADRHDGIENWRYKRNGDAGEFVQPKGRWPANVILTHHPECEPAGTKKIKGDGRKRGDGKRGSGFVNVGASNGDGKHNGPVYGNEEVGVWKCHADCPVRLLDEQTGTLKSGWKSSDVPQSTQASVTAFGAEEVTGPHYGDSGGASRFFYCAKVAKKERNGGLEGANNHPTVKPIDLMRYLCRLVTPPNGVVLDFCAGSGSTGCAAVLEGFRFIGIEQDANYVRISRARITHWEQQT